MEGSFRFIKLGAHFPTPKTKTIKQRRRVVPAAAARPIKIKAVISSSRYRAAKHPLIRVLACASLFPRGASGVVTSTRAPPHNAVAWPRIARIGSATQAMKARSAKAKAAAEIAPRIAPLLSPLNAHSVPSPHAAGREIARAVGAGKSWPSFQATAPRVAVAAPTRPSKRAEHLGLGPPKRPIKPPVAPRAFRRLASAPRAAAVAPLRQRVGRRAAA